MIKENFPNTGYFFKADGFFYVNVNLMKTQAFVDINGRQR